jgi:hypothetical protein
MSRATLPRTAYRFILRVHPNSFRERFAEEMLWIFDEESREGNTASLLLDGAISAVRQHAKDPIEADRPPAAFAAGIATAAISPRRIVQGGLLASILTYGFFVLLARNGTYKIPKVAPHSCSYGLSAPPYIPSPPKPPSLLGKQ